MALPLPFLNGANRKKRAQMIAVDLGSRTTKAALFERRGEILALTRYALLDAPIFEKKISPELLGDHLKSVAEALGNATKYISVAVGLEDAMVRQIELPQIPLDEMRQILKVNHKNYLQQDLPNHVFDCYIIPPRALGAADKAPAGGGTPKLKVLAAAAKQQLINDFMQATQLAGLTAECMVPGLIGPMNTFEQALPDVYAKETVALVDIGFKHTSVCVLDRGELALTRVVNIGGDQLTAGLAEAMSISYAEAEGIKVGMAPEVENALQMQVIPLGREIRASLDFFEHQQDRPVTQVYMSGASARSEMILQMLHSELLLECKT
jgi:type IV pilus assembly protein PilM